MHEGTHLGHQESEKPPMSHATVSAAEPRLASLLSSPVVRPDAVARARRLLQTPSWCRAQEVADELVDCFVDRRFP